eukprot:3049686-Rhodomonas_salina.1
MPVFNFVIFFQGNRPSRPLFPGEAPFSSTLQGFTPKKLTKLGITDEDARRSSLGQELDPDAVWRPAVAAHRRTNPSRIPYPASLSPIKSRRWVWWYQSFDLMHVSGLPETYGPAARSSGVWTPIICVRMLCDARYWHSVWR